jgi:hypothetical protein
VLSQKKKKVREEVMSRSQLLHFLFVIKCHVDY